MGINKLALKGMCIIVLIQLVFCAVNVSGLGITPTKAVYDYEEGATKSFDFKVITSGVEVEKEYVITPVVFPEHGFEKTAEEDERLLIPNFDISETNPHIAPHRRKPIKVTFTMPEFETPGEHGCFIKVTEKTERSRNSGVSAKPAVLYTVEINVPYPGKYVELELDAPNTEVGKKVFFFIFF